MRSLFKDGRRPYFWCERAFLQLGCSAIEIALYCVLADSANQEDRCWPSYDALAARLAISRRTAIRGVKRLCELRAVHKTTQINPTTGKSINIYELVDLPRVESGTGDTHVTGDIHDTPRVTPVSPHGCHQSTSNKEPLNKERGNKEQAAPPDLLWEHFSAGFRKHAGHAPKPSAKQRAAFKELTDSLPAALIHSKIDAWWVYSSPRLTGNRTLGAFLQWFDEIPVLSSDHESTSMGIDPVTAMTSGSPEGRQVYEGLVRDLSDIDAKIRTLICYGYAKEESDARDIIERFESPCP